MRINIKNKANTSWISRLMMLGFVWFLCFGTGILSAHAQDAGTSVSSKYYTASPVRLPDGNTLLKTIISGPPKPPPGFEVQRSSASLPERDIAAGVNVLTVPAFTWVFGCSAVSGSMVAGYYDRNGYPNMYTGPTNGGLMPLDNRSWPTWTDGVGDTYPNNPLTASKSGVDDRTSRGSIDDYWIGYNSTAADPYITGSWTQHTWGTAIGDYMKTSQSYYRNSDGSTTFYNYISSAAPLTCDDMLSGNISQYDGTYGRKLFYEAKGYTVTDCYNQKTDNKIAGGFSFAQFKAQIDANRPVMLNLAGHSIVGVGYDTSSNLVYIHDTWDYSDHTMLWGGSYSGMALQSVSIVNLAAIPSPSTAKLYASFTGYGLYSWNDTAWTGLSSLIPTNMVASGTDLYASFTGYGLYKWNGSAWIGLTSLIATNMVASGTDLYASFTGYGLYKWNGSAWSGLASLIPTNMVASGTDLYASFTGYGLYKWNGSAWSQLNTIIPVAMVAP